MSEKRLRASRCIENFIPPNIIENSVHQVCASVADAFLGQIEYGKDYVINTWLVKDDLVDGFGTKYTYNLQFDELVRCRDCAYICNREYVNGLEYHTCSYFDSKYAEVEPDGFCAWGERKC